MAARRVRRARPAGTGALVVLLVLALLASACIAFALGRSGLLPGGRERPVLALVLDASSSMRTRLPVGHSRWVQAKALARDLVAAEHPDTRFVVADTSEGGTVRGPFGAGDALAALDVLPPPTGGRTGMPMLPAARGDPRRIEFISDGVSGIEPGEGAGKQTVFQRADNAGVMSFRVEITPNDVRRSIATAVIRNASPRTRNVDLELRGSAGSIHRSLTLESGQTVAETADVSRLGAGTLRAVVHLAGDAYDEDNEKVAAAPDPGVRRILLVSRSSGVLESALRALPGVSLRFVRPQAFSGVSGVDACVFDDFQPADPPGVPSLWFQRSASAGAVVAASPKVTRIAGAHPLGSVVPWRDLRFRRAVLADPADGEAHDTPVVLAAMGTSDREGALVRTSILPHRRIVAGFGMNDSDIASKPDLIVFLAAALDWMTAGSSTLMVSPASRTGAQAALETDTDGNGTRRRPDALYRAAAGDRSRAEQAEAVDINASAWPEAAHTRAGPGGRQAPRFDPAVAALWVAVVLLAFEWVAFVRGRTV
ncbi:MAG: VWA domain-containing protein [Betaproteobacteria bacterium]|nr:VWA domain-containing protein [Betaproteobacteria bacterium]